MEAFVHVTRCSSFATGHQGLGGYWADIAQLRLTISSSDGDKCGCGINNEGCIVKMAFTVDGGVQFGVHENPVEDSLAAQNIS